MRVCVLHLGAPSPSTGARRTWNALEWLAARHEVRVVPVLNEFTDDEEGPEAPAGVAVEEPLALTRRSRARLKLGLPPDARQRGALARRLLQASADADWLWIACPDVAFAADAMRAAARRAAITWDWDAIALWNLTALRALARTDPARAARHALQLVPALDYERRRLPLAHLATVPSMREQRWLRRTAAMDVEVVRNFVDVPAALPGPRPRASTALFVGSDFTPNLHGLRWLLRDAWPHVRARAPQARLRVVGRGMTAERLGVTAPGVEFVGPVPDTGPHYAAADVFVAPVFYGGGTQNKVLEAGAAGLPVVTTSYTLATLGEDAEGYAVAADAADWGETVAGLLGDPERAATAGRACFETVRRTYSRAPWEDDLRRVEGLVTARRAGWPA